MEPSQAISRRSAARLGSPRAEPGPARRDWEGPKGTFLHMLARGSAGPPLAVLARVANLWDEVLF